MKKQVAFGIFAIALIAAATACWCSTLDGKIADAKAARERDEQAVENIKKEIAIIDAAIVYYERLAEARRMEHMKYMRLYK